MDKIFFSYGNYGSDHTSKFNEINKYLEENPNARVVSVTPAQIRQSENQRNFGFVVVVSNR